MDGIRFGRKFMIIGHNYQAEREFAQKEKSRLVAEGEKYVAVDTNGQNWFVFTDRDAQKVIEGQALKANYERAQNAPERYAFLKNLEALETYKGFSSRLKEMLNGKEYVNQELTADLLNRVIERVAKHFYKNITHVAPSTYSHNAERLTLSA